MAALVEDLLLLARLDEGRPLGNDLVDLSQIAHEVLEDLSAMYNTLHVVDEIDDFVTATGDSIRLRQVLSNLVSNAILHTPSGTHVRLSLKRDGEKSLIEVQDDGPGMDSEDATRSFERFWRGSPARRGPGSGLGPSIVAGIVAAHQGTVEMTTELGRGTKVRVILLARPAPVFLAESLGVAPALLLKALTDNPLASSYALAKLNRMLDQDFHSDFALDWALKDLDLVASDDGDDAAPVAGAIAERWRGLVSNGSSGLDVSAARRGLGRSELRVPVTA